MQSGARYRVIPWQMGAVAKVLRLLPDALFDCLLAGLPRKHRHGSGPWVAGRASTGVLLLHGNGNGNGKKKRQKKGT